KYPDNVTLEQTAVITNNGIREYCIWNRYYTVDTLVEEIYEAGFKKFEVFSDVTGKSYMKDSPTIAILLEK
ncbi:MAG: putative methyltransferase, partial [Herbinix sp.]|nr:putative methyltransferase [Herbinix sp.]